MPFANFPIPNTLDGSWLVPIFGTETGGKAIFVKPSSGSDTNTGLNPDDAVKTLSQALTLATANKNDTVYLISESTSAASTTDYQSATLTWNKNLVHLVGIGPPVHVSQRSRIEQLTAATAISPLVTVSASGCVFKNIQIFHGSSSASSLIAVLVSGDRNYFENVHFAGMGNDTQDASGGRSLKVTGSENEFFNCTIGLDTISRGTTEAEVELSGGATRNYFKKCRFTTYAAATGPAMVYVPVNGLDRYTLMEDCIFINMPTGDAAGTTADEVFDVTGGGSPDGIIIVSGNSGRVGYTDWEKDTASGKVVLTMPAAGDGNNNGEGIDAS